MTWVKLDDGFTEHPKVLGLSDAAFRLHVLAICYASRNLTDGLVPLVWLTGGRSRAFPTKIIAQIVAAGLWTEQGTDFVIHDYLEYQPSREQVELQRDRNTARIQLFRDKDMRELIRARDKDLCRYCGQVVVWHDRRGLRGGTYDHVIPNGNNSETNIVVACRSCNSTKSCRTPAEARMVLLDPGQSKSVSKSDLNPDLNRTFAPSRPVPIDQEKKRAAAAPGSPLAFTETHRGHINGFCQFMCFSEQKAQEFAKTLSGGTAVLANFDTVVAWASGVRDAWGGKEIAPSELKWYDFWEARWKEKSGTSGKNDAVLQRLVERFS